MRNLNAGLIFLHEELKLWSNVIVCTLDVVLAFSSCEDHLATRKDESNNIILGLLLIFVEHVAIDESGESVVVGGELLVILVFLDLVETD